MVNGEIFGARYFLSVQVPFFPVLIANFGVRTKADFFPVKPSITATALCKESPIDTAKNNGKSITKRPNFWKNGIGGRETQ